MFDNCLKVVALKNAKKADLSPTKKSSFDNIKTYLLVNKVTSEKSIRQQHIDNNSAPSWDDFKIYWVYDPRFGFNQDLKTLKAIKQF